MAEFEDLLLAGKAGKKSAAAEWPVITATVPRERGPHESAPGYDRKVIDQDNPGELGKLGVLHSGRTAVPSMIDSGETPMLRGLAQVAPECRPNAGHPSVSNEP